VKGTCKEGSRAVYPGEQLEEALEMGISFHRGPVGEPGGGGSSTVNFERQMKGAVGMERLSLKRFSVEGLWGGHLYWRPWNTC